MNKKLLFSLLVVVNLTACTSDKNHEDIKQWMIEEEKKLKGKVDKIPEIKKFKQTAYEAKSDPFEMKEKIILKDFFKNKYSPDLERVKEDLEYFEISELKMVGSVNKEGQMFAMLKDTEDTIHYITVGNYMGKNYGKVLDITESYLVLDERVKTNDDWIVKETKIYLFEGK